ncbi:MAG TPA: hypothetical protein VJB60_01375 [Candidatus Peribacterales bacterium]|nr:hypothetical protein [Candidatus Peribacterales bacterium]
MNTSNEPPGSSAAQLEETLRTEESPDSSASSAEAATMRTANAAIYYELIGQTLTLAELSQRAEAAKIFLKVSATSVGNQRVTTLSNGKGRDMEDGEGCVVCAYPIGAVTLDNKRVPGNIEVRVQAPMSKKGEVLSLEEMQPPQENLN